MIANISLLLKKPSDLELCYISKTADRFFAEHIVINYFYLF